MPWKRFPHYRPICEERPPVTSGSPHKESVMQRFYDSFAISLNELLNKQSNCPWLKPLWPQCHSLYWLIFIFSSAADLVSGAYRITSRPSSHVGHLSSTRPLSWTFFKSNRLLRFHPIFGMNVHNNVGQKPVEWEFIIFTSNLLWIINYKKLRILEVLAIGSLSFHPIIPICGLNVHNNIVHKIVGP